MTGVQGWWNAKWQIAQTNWPIIELCTQLCTNYVLVIQCVSSSTWHYQIRNCSFRWRRPTMVSDSVTYCTLQWFTTANIVARWMWACVKFVKWKASPIAMVVWGWTVMMAVLTSMDTSLLVETKSSLKISLWHSFRTNMIDLPCKPRCRGRCCCGSRTWRRAWRYTIWGTSWWWCTIVPARARTSTRGWAWLRPSGCWPQG